MRSRPPRYTGRAFYFSARAHTVYGMAYCGYENGYKYRRYRGHVRGRARRIVALALLMALLSGLFLWLRLGVAETLYAASEAQVRSLTSSAVNDAVLTTLQWNGASYDSVVHIERDGEGNVVGISADAQSVNLIARQTVSLSMANLNAACAEGVPVPLGAFTGIGLLAGMGPEVTFRVLPVGTVTCDLVSSLTSAGINQSLHSVSLEVTAAAEIVLPTGSREVSTVTEVLLCESVIVGRVPEVLFGGNLFEGVL